MEPSCSEQEVPPRCPPLPAAKLQLQSTASPFDYVKAGAVAADRRIALGLTPSRLSDSFVGNQSFPRRCVTSQQLARRLESPCLVGGGGDRSTDGLVNSSLLAQGGRGSRMMQNPNKGWAIVSAEKGLILINNSVLTTLLGYSDQTLSNTRLWDLIVKKRKEQCSLDQLDFDPESGDSLSYSGRVVDLKTAGGQIVTVSLNVKQLVDSTRMMVFLEPVQRTVGQLDLDWSGRIVHLDEGAESIFQTRSSDCHGEHVDCLIPGLQLPGQEEGSQVKQACTGRGEQDISFPVSCIVTRDEQGMCQTTVWVYSSLSGLILLDSEGRVTEADQTFTSLVLGYSSLMTGMKVEEVIPGFYDEFDVPSCDDSLETSEISPLEEISLNTGMSGLGLQSPVKSSLPGSPVVRRQESEQENITDSPVFKRPSSLMYNSDVGVVQHRTPVKVAMELLTSTPARRGEMRGWCKSDDRSHIPSGCFYGLARHKTGADISVLYHVKKVILSSGDIVHCVWVTRDSEDLVGRSEMGHLTLATTREVDLSCDVSDTGVESLISGPYEQKYVTLHQVGQGAFGCVKLAYRLEDRLLVVTKFITKSKVPPDNWVVGSQDGEEIPLEASLLSTLDHPNIVGVLDIYQNSTTVQMVMTKCGEMDLFEFIDRNPVMEEGLASLIFRQIVAAIHFLHNNQILHRDIKDENIILDSSFHCKLIDFGSATYFKPGEEFSTFYGTVEYCSPEVLRGYKYCGPELESWSLGVLLYILMFGENPFYDPTDTLRAQLHPPHNDLSPQCWELIESCLESDPSTRASVWYIKEHPWVEMSGVTSSDYSLSEVISCSESERHPPTHYLEGDSLDIGRQAEFSSLDSNKEESQEHFDVEDESTLETSNEYSNLITTQELNELELQDESSVNYSNIQSTQELEEKEL